MTLNVSPKLKGFGWLAGFIKTSKKAEPGPTLYNASEIALLKQRRIEADKIASEVVARKGRKLNSRIIEARKAGSKI